MSLRRIGRAVVAALFSVTLVDGAGYVRAAAFIVNNGADTTDGIACNALRSANGTRVQGCTARDNGGDGIRLQGGVDVLGTSISDSAVVHNGTTGLLLVADQHVTNTKVTNVVARTNQAPGVALQGMQVNATAITNVLASGNMDFGVELVANDVNVTALKAIVADGNKAGIGLSAAKFVIGTKISDVKASGNQLEGIIVGGDLGVMGTKITRALVSGNGADGVRLQGTKNVVQQVRASGNGGDGIHLAAPGSNNTVTKSSTAANDGVAGIEIDTGSTSNVVQKNVSLGNDGRDLQDGNPTCDGNTWKSNAFQTRNDPCVE
jgi:Right handed beta helix region